MVKSKLVRITTVPISLQKLLEGQLQYMNLHYDVIAISSGKQDLQKVGELQGVRVHPVEMTRKITPFKDLGALWRLLSYFIKEKPLIVHTHTPKAGTLGMIAAMLARVPIRLHTVAGLPLMEATGLKRKLLDLVEKITYRCATHVYSNSHGLSEIILANGFCRPEKLNVIGEGSSNGINTNHFDPTLFDVSSKTTIKEELGISQNDFVFIYVGRLVGDKGINELIEAFTLIISDKINVKLLLVGPYEEFLDPLTQGTINEIHSNDKIIEVGFKDDVRPYLAVSDCFVFPSYREGFPNAVMQAGSMNLPCIVTDINGCNEIIEEGINGTIIPVKSSDALLMAMKKMVFDSEWKDQMGGRSRAIIMEKYDREKIWKALLTEYKVLERNV